MIRGYGWIPPRSANRLVPSGSGDQAEQRQDHSLEPSYHINRLSTQIAQYQKAMARPKHQRPQESHRYQNLQWLSFQVTQPPTDHRFGWSEGFREGIRLVDPVRLRQPQDLPDVEI